MKDLFIIGTGSQARYVIENLKNSQAYSVRGLIDIERQERMGQVINGIRIASFLHDSNFEIAVPKGSSLIVAYGKNDAKRRIVNDLEKRRYEFAAAISQASYISDHVLIGEGCIINPNVTIMPNTKIGRHVIIHSGSVIEHDNYIGDFANIAPGVVTAGNVTVGEGSYVYTGAIILPGVRIGKDCIVGAGAVVLEDIVDGCTVVGVPARVIKNGG